MIETAKIFRKWAVKPGMLTDVAKMKEHAYWFAETAQKLSKGSFYD